jgi:hypothetical protein
MEGGWDIKTPGRFEKPVIAIADWKGEVSAT